MERVAVIGSAWPAGRALVEQCRRRQDLEVTLVEPVGEDHHLPDRLARFEGGTVFLALQHGFAAGLAGPLLQRGVRVIDLSADHRLPPAERLEVWGSYPSVQLLDRAVPGLVEIERARLRRAGLISMPGAGVAGALLAGWPLLEAGLLLADGAGVVLVGEQIDAGDGRPEVLANRTRPPPPGSVDPWPHAQAELAHFLQRFRVARVTGVHVRAGPPGTLLALLTGEVATEDAGDFRVLQAALEAAPDEPGRRVLPAGQSPDLERVRGSPAAEVAVWVDGYAGRITCACALDLAAFSAGAALRALDASRGA